jgi:hypothetical protein
MKKSFAIVALLVTIGSAGGAFALANSVHHKAVQSPHQQATNLASQHAVTAPAGRTSKAIFPTSSPFVLCQRQDPTTPALRAGASGCVALPY